MAEAVTTVDLGVLLAVFAHPDDEAYLAGGLMALSRDAGRRVVCVTATRGELGFPDDDARPIEERAAVRTAEMAECLAVLGVAEHRWLEYPDGGCESVPVGEPVRTLRSLIEEIEPDTVVTFEPNGQTYHRDHIAISRWTTLAVRSATPHARLLYAVMTPEWVEEFSQHVPMSEVMMIPDAEPPTTPVDELALWFVSSGDVLDRKVRALRCQKSQVEGIVEQVGEATYARLVRDEFFREPTAADWAS